jgi:uncharacterized membrane protein HdeD (DUF308 family)
MLYRWWTYGLVGMAWVAVGGIALLGLLLSSTIHWIVLAVSWGLLLGGALQYIHGLFGTGSNVFLNVLVGFFYSLAGAFIILNATEGAPTLSIGVAAVIIFSGLLRFYLAYHSWESRGWLLTISGVFGVLAGTLIHTSVWGFTVFWCSLALDLLTHGTWWLLLSREKW